MRDVIRGRLANRKTHALIDVIELRVFDISGLILEKEGHAV